MLQKNPDNRTLWIGDIEPWMNESTIEEIFNKFGRIMNVKLVRPKESISHGGVGYCFVEFETHDQADGVITKYSQRPIPGISNTFRMNWSNNRTPGMAPRSAYAPGGYPAQMGQYYPSMAMYGGGYQQANRYGAVGADMQQYYQYQQPVVLAPANGASYSRNQDYQLYVGELQPNVTEPMLLDHFKCRLQTAIGAKIVIDPLTKQSKGFGFVKLINSSEVGRAVSEMNGSILQGKAIKVSQAATRAQPHGGAAGTAATTTAAATSTYGATASSSAYTGGSYYAQQATQPSYYQQSASYVYDQSQQNAAWLSYQQQQQQQYAQYYANTAVSHNTPTSVATAVNQQDKPYQQPTSPYNPTASSPVSAYSSTSTAASTYPAAIVGPGNYPVQNVLPGYPSYYAKPAQQLPIPGGQQAYQQMPGAMPTANGMVSYHNGVGQVGGAPLGTKVELPSVTPNLVAPSVPAPSNNQPSLGGDGISTSQSNQQLGQFPTNFQAPLPVTATFTGNNQAASNIPAILHESQQQQKQLQFGKPSGVQFMSYETDFLEEDPERICAISNLQFALGHSLQ